MVTTPKETGPDPDLPDDGPGANEPMRVGVVFPQTEIGADVSAVRAFGRAIEELGYDHVMAYDHVLGADPALHPGWNWPYDIDSTFHEPMVLFGYLAAITDLELVTGVLVLPQRQTALAAKQAAQVDLMTGGNFRFGVGVGWNPVEYEALDQPFGRRGRRIEEQIELLRALWSDRSVTFRGEFDSVNGAGLAPMPIQRPIPIWVGGNSEAAFDRIGRLADGWFPRVRPGQSLERGLRRIAEAAEEVGRSADDIGMEGQAHWTPKDPDGFLAEVDLWREIGATHLAVNTLGCGLAGVDDHVAALRLVAQMLELDPEP